MKSKTRVSSQVLILFLAALVILFMVQVAQAQDLSNPNSTSTLIAQSSTNQNNQLSSTSFRNGNTQIMEVDLAQKSLPRRILDKTTLSYYQQFLGPTFSGPTTETYNVFQEGLNNPGTGRAPLQSFHAASLRYQINSDFAAGVSLAAVNGYTKEVENESTRGNVTNTPATDFFNARAFLVLPAYRTRIGTLYSTVAYEAPTSTISRNDNMTWGWVISESFSFNLPSPKWSVGLLGQYYRAYFNHDRNTKAPPFEGGQPVELQAVIVSGGPYMNYRFNDHWQFNSLITLDWDQRGPQAGRGEYNNNLPHRGRAGFTYFPNSIKYLSSVGVFTQALLKFRPETTAVGADFAVRF